MTSHSRAAGQIASAPQTAVTHVRPLATTETHTFARVSIETGRTHQIRAQASHHGHPLTGDRKYGSAGRGPYYLHAASLMVRGETAELGFTRLEAALPGPFSRRVAQLFGEDARTLY